MIVSSVETSRGDPSSFSSRPRHSEVLSGGLTNMVGATEFANDFAGICKDKMLHLSLT